jgi:hypothetical protein
MVSCSVCLSKDVRVNERGLYICSNNHVVQSIHEELNEYDGSYGGLRKVSKFIQTKKETNTPQAISVIQTLILTTSRKVIEYFSLSEFILQDIKHIWALYLQRNRDLLLNLLYLDKNSLRETCSLSSILSFIFISLQENLIPLTRMEIFKFFQTLDQGDFFLSSYEKMFPKSMLPSILSLEYGTFSKKIDQNANLLLGIRHYENQSLNVITLNNLIHKMNPRLLHCLNESNFKKTAWKILKSPHKFYSEEIFFWQKLDKLFTFKHRCISLYPAHCKHYTDIFAYSILEEFKYFSN